MIRLAATGLLMLWVCSGLGALRAQDAVAITLEADCDPAVDFGVAFEITVTRRWPRGWQPGPFVTSSLAPLRVREESRRFEQGDTESVEIIALSAYAFQTKPCTIAPLRFSAASPDGVSMSSETEAFEISISPTPAAEGPMEAPGPLLSDDAGAKRPAGALLLGLLIFTTVLIGAYRWWIRRTPIIDAPDATHAALARLADVTPTDPELLAAFVRHHLSSVHGIAPGRLVAGETAEHPLIDVLERCDHVRFARPADAPERSARLHRTVREIIASGLEEAGGS